MELTVTITSALILILLILFPFLLLRFIKNKFSAKDFIINVFLLVMGTIFLSILITWWSSFSTELLLNHYGYDPLNSSDRETFLRVGSSNFHRVMELKKSYLGIGWPLKVGYLSIFSIPYSLIIFLLGIYFSNKREKANIKII